MTQIPGLLTLGEAENLWEAKWSGWAMAPGRRSSLALLENEVGSTGNEVIQEASLGFRRGRLSFTTTRANRDLIRGYDEAGTDVTFTDEDGSTCSVIVDSAQADWVFDELWHVTVALIQLTEPVPA